VPCCTGSGFLRAGAAGKTEADGLCLMVCLPRREGLDGYQEGEDAGACRRNNDQEHEQRQSTEDEDDLGGWRKLLEFLKRLFEMHGFPFLSLSGILRQISWCRPLTRRTYAIISHRNA
jgi:hypothetical protein